jgi:hypothetical protein
MTPEEEQCRDVYNNFGVAAYYAQCFEKGLCNFLVHHKIPRGVTLEEYETAERSIHKRTLGQLLQAARPFLVFADTANEALFNEAVDKRNFLLHDYFWERAFTIDSPDGRARMLAELTELRSLFQRANRVVESLTLAAVSGDGITQEMLLAERERMARDAKVDGQS